MNNSNTGDWNTGDSNTGDWNTGDSNTGDSNTGYSNTGYWNTGDRNTGGRNTGDLNTGDRNTGDWNTGDSNTGYLNTTEPSTIRIFNKECNISRDDLDNMFPDYFFFDLTEWIPANAMTDKEKEEFDTYKTTGGYLRSHEYQEAFRKSWDNTTQEDREKTLKLPNWDNDLFEEISGIDVEKELKASSVKEFSMDEVAKALGIDVKDLKIKKD